MAFEDFCRYFSKATMCHLMNTSMFSFSKRWHLFKHNNEWKPGFSAGGCVVNQDTFFKNPQVLKIDWNNKDLLRTLDVWRILQKFESSLYTECWESFGARTSFLPLPAYCLSLFSFLSCFLPSPSHTLFLFLYSSYIDAFHLYGRLDGWNVSCCWWVCFGWESFGAWTSFLPKVRVSFVLHSFLPTNLLPSLACLPAFLYLPSLLPTFLLLLPHPLLLTTDHLPPNSLMPSLWQTG